MKKKTPEQARGVNLTDDESHAPAAKKITLPTFDPKTCPLPDAYYFPFGGGKDYLLRDGDDFMPLTEGSLKKHLRLLEPSFTNEIDQKTGLRTIDLVVSRIQRDHRVVYAGRVAGHLSGLLHYGKKSILVTESPTIISPTAGEWPLLQMVIGNLLEDSAVYFYCWLKVAFETLFAGSLAPGQVLVLAGPINSGKSLLQQIISASLGGEDRQVNPWQYITSGTSFNSDLIGAEHLAIDDPPGLLSARDRERLTANLKEMVNPQPKRCHGKNKDGFMLPLYWRVSISINDSPETLTALPTISDEGGTADKFILLRCRQHAMPRPTGTPEEKKVFWAELKAEIPHMLHHLMQAEIDEVLREEKPRFGVKHYHDPELLRRINAQKPETLLWEMIQDVLPPGAPWRGTASALEFILRDVYGREVDKILYFANACGSYLGALKKRYPTQIVHHENHDPVEWSIFRGEKKV